MAFKAAGPKMTGPKKVSAPSRPSFVLGSRPPDLYAPRLGPKPNGDILAPPRIQPGAASTRQYGKKQAAAPSSPFGDTGLTGES